jgi:hypothetical protein
MSHCYLNLWLPKPIFQRSLLLNLWSYPTEMWESVCLRGTTLQVSVATSRSQTYFRGLYLSKNWKGGIRKEPDPGCKVDEAGQSTEAMWWPLGYADLCAASHYRGDEALLSHLYGDEPSGNDSSEFPHILPSWSFGLWVTRLWVSPFHIPKRLSPWSCWLKELP